MVPLFALSDTQIDWYRAAPKSLGQYIDCYRGEESRAALALIRAAEFEPFGLTGEWRANHRWRSLEVWDRRTGWPRRLRVDDTLVFAALLKERQGVRHDKRRLQHAIRETKLSAVLVYRPRAIAPLFEWV
ncbi:hypothetical protein [Botrimarina sp.]|uniref:hypothetical protein n=1 Tax=Botrimarina sp. TaxID=2795802 RepID=UPI0032EFD57F